MKRSEKSFDKNYYDKFYGSKESRVTDRHEIARLAAYVCNYLKHIQQPVHDVLDMGCGLGYWKNQIKKHFPSAKYTGVEYSSYLCDKYGWEQGSAVTYRSKKKFDLIICQGVLQYLDSQSAEKAINNLKKLTRGALYLEVLTKMDWEDHCEKSVSDGQVFLRSVNWYKRNLKPFKNLGGGIFLSPQSESVLYEIEYTL